MQKSALLAAIQQEIQRHDYSHSVENLPHTEDRTISQPQKSV
jgi:hypothetical protein